MNNHLPKTLLSIAAAACLCACVNEEYDIEKIQIDEIHILDNATAPLGSTKKFMLSDLFSGFDSEEYLKTDKDGNYYFEYIGDVITTDIAVPTFIFDGYSDENPHKTTVKSKIDFPELASGTRINSTVTTDPVELEKITYQIELSQTDIPKEVLYVRYANVESTISVRIALDLSSSSFSKVWIPAGAQLNFPEWIVLGDAPDGFEKVDYHTLVSDKDISVAATDIRINIPLDGLDFSKVPDGQGIVNPGELYLNAEVEFEGSVYLSSDDYTNNGVSPFSPTLISYLNMDPMTIQSAEVELNIEELGYAEFEAKLNDVEGALEDLDATIDLSDLRLNIGISSTLPSAVNLATSITTPTKKYDLDPFLIPAATTTPATAYYSISESGEGAPENYQNVAVENWNSILSPLPETVRFTMLPSPRKDAKYMTITPGDTFEIIFDYSFSSNAFGPDFKIETTQTFNGMGVNLGTSEIPWAQLTLNAVNTLPVNLSLAAQAIDSEGNILNSIESSVSADIKGGSLDNPAVTPVTLNFKSNGPIEFDGLIFTITASSASDRAVLNRNQYIQLTDMALTLPSGMTLKFDNNDE